MGEEMKRYYISRPKANWLILLTLICLSCFAAQISAQCCCGGVHVSAYGKNKKPIGPVVTALVGSGTGAEAIIPRLIEPKVSEKGLRTTKCRYSTTNR